MLPASYVWTEQYQSAVLELDSEKLTAHITNAEKAIRQRKAELVQEPSASTDELQAIGESFACLDVTARYCGNVPSSKSAGRIVHRPCTAGRSPVVSWLVDVTQNP